MGRGLGGVALALLLALPAEAGWFSRDTAKKPEGPVFPEVSDAETRGRCGSCHLAFQPSMLPAESWKRMMAGLDDHFGVPVKMSAKARQRVTTYLARKSGDTEAAGDVGKMAIAGLARGAKPLRITETPYFREKHRPVTTKVLADWVGSIANCVACHVGAGCGDYTD